MSGEPPKQTHQPYHLKEDTCMEKQILQQILDKLQSFEEEQKVMKQTLNKLDSIENEQLQMKKTLNKLDSIENEQFGMKQTLDEMKQAIFEMKQEQHTTNYRLHQIETLVVDIPLIRQATLESLEISKRIETTGASFERKVAAELNTHGFGIDILNR
jgi:vacuolar-type H+-ATPase subunit I/STV1